MKKILTVMLIIILLGTVVALTYVLANPRVGEKFTEFYLLGINGQAADYPTHFTIVSSQFLAPSPEPQEFNVQYGKGTIPVNEKWGRVTLGIVNHERRQSSYIIKMVIDGQQVGIPFNSGNVQEIGPVVLAPENRWEQEIGIIPQHTGNNQKVELFLYKDDGNEPYLNVDLWINVE